MPRLLAVRDARVFLAGQTVSSFGDMALWLASAIWVKALTGSSAAAGLVFFFFCAPTLLAPVCGLIVDRMERARLLVAVNALTGCTVLLLLLVHSASELWLIYLVMFLYGLSSCTLAATQSALLRALLPGDLLADANGLLRTIQAMLSLVAPLTGAGLYALVGPRTLVLLDAASFVFPMFCALSLRVSEPRARPRAQSLRAELNAGIRHIARSPVLRHLIAASICAVLGFGFSETTVFAVAGKGLHKPPAFVGVLVGIQGLGAVLGGLSAAPLIRRIGERSLIALGLMLTCAGALLEIPSWPPMVLAGLVVFGFSLPWVLVGLTTLVQRSTPPELQGRVYAAADAVITVPQTISIALGAALIGIIGYRALLAAMAASNALAGAYLVGRYRRRVPSRINHVSINADDLQDSVDFYVELLRAEPIPTPNFGLPVQWLALGRTQLHLFERDMQPTSHHHFGITVDDLEPVYRAAERRGAFDHQSFRNHLVELPGDVVQLYLRDPAGNLIEIDHHGVDRLPEDMRAQLKGLWEFNPQDEEQMRGRLFVPE
ncbi:MAG: MFS transporter [Solirubrobacterales bacterium]|nr:MFS transporter [Solirubrobacterales bacterium]